MNNLPDVFLSLYNITASIGYFFNFLRYLIMGISVVWTIVALMNIWGLTTAETNGQMNKLFPSKAQPTLGSAWFQLFIAGATFILAYNLLPATLFSAILTGSTTPVQNYSVGSYIPNPTGAQIETMGKNLVFSLFGLMGLVAFFRGFVTWWQIAQGTTDKTASRVLGFFFFGALCFNIKWFHDLLVSILGFDFLSILS